MQLILSHGENYAGDVLFRSYINQDINRNNKELFCSEVLTRNGYKSKYAGRYTSEHPQGVKQLAQKVVDEFKNKNCIVELSNEYSNCDSYNTCLGAEFQAKDWFNGAFSQIKRSLCE